MRGPQNDMNKVESYLWESLRDGAYDFHDDDSQWELSYRSMRYSATNDTLLWMLLKKESTRVGPPFDNVLIVTDWRSQGDRLEQELGAVTIVAAQKI